MKYSIDKSDKYAVMKLQEPNLNAAVAPFLKSDFVILANEGIRNLILDLSDVRFVDSSGLSAILTADRLWKGNNGSFILLGELQTSVRKLIEISRLEDVLTIVHTLDEAIDYIYMDEIERELQAESDSDS